MMGIKADAIALLTQLAEGGALRPRDVVDAARSHDSPLHKYFTWDNAKAAEQLRISEARKLIARVRVTMETGPLKVVTVRAFHSLPSDRGRIGYRPIAGILSDEDRRRELLQTALRELAAFRRRYRDLAELSSVLAAIDGALEEGAQAANG